MLCKVVHIPPGKTMKKSEILAQFRAQAAVIKHNDKFCLVLKQDTTGNTAPVYFSEKTILVTK